MKVKEKAKAKAKEKAKVKADATTGKEMIRKKQHIITTRTMAASIG